MNRSDWPLFHYRGTVERVLDGDTISVFLDLGDRTYRSRRIRLLGYDAPELFSGDDRGSGADAKAALEAIIPVGSTVYIATHLDHTSFDRLLGKIYAAGSGDELLDVAASMKSIGYDVPVRKAT